MLKFYEGNQAFEYVVIMTLVIVLSLIILTL